MDKNFLVFLKIIFIIGFLYIFLFSFSWRILPGMLAFFLQVILVIGGIIVLINLFLVSISILIKSWGGIKFLSILPLASILVMTFLCIFIPPKIISSYQDYFFKKNYRLFCHAGKLAIEGSFVSKKNGLFQLATPFKNLSADREIAIISDEKNINVVFFLRRWPSGSDEFIYSPTQIIIGDPSYLEIKKIKKDWFLVFEH